MVSSPQCPILSVGVPLYNMKGCVSRCLDSLVHDDGPYPREDLEILVVDDGSTDGSAEVALRYETRHPGLKVLSKVNGGHGSAVDYARQSAKGVYFLVVDSDDEVLPGALRKVAAFLRWMTDRGLEIDALVLERAYEDESTGKRRYCGFRHAIPSNRTFGWKDVGRFVFSETLSMHSLVFRRAHLDDSHLHLPHKTYYVDALYTFVPLAHAKRFYHLPFPLYVYHLGRPGQSVSTSFALKHTDDRMRVSRALVAEMDRVPRDAVRSQRRYLDGVLAAFLVVTLGTLTLSDRDDKERKKAGLFDWIRRTRPAIYRKVSRVPLVSLARLQGGIGRFVTRIGYRIADAGNMLV